MGDLAVSSTLHRYLDNVVNKQSISPPIPHLHALLTSGDDPPAEVDIFDLLKVSYEVSTHWLQLGHFQQWWGGGGASTCAGLGLTDSPSPVEVQQPEG